MRPSCRTYHHIRTFGRKREHHQKSAGTVYRAPEPVRPIDFSNHRVGHVVAARHHVEFRRPRMRNSSTTNQVLTLFRHLGPTVHLQRQEHAHRNRFILDELIPHGGTFSPALEQAGQFCCVLCPLIRREPLDVPQTIGGVSASWPQHLAIFKSRFRRLLSVVQQVSSVPFERL